ncbi:SGNH/GDSL hydrolase family protein [Streptomyces sp. NPDC051162]|uniref:SGNH/GDSL hydrolase family protein n=1 Tax=unclassified Streptomyces TaxID=2593676 RepID=UPI00341435D7
MPLKAPRLPLALLLSALLLTGGQTAAAHADAPSVDSYVALGDSYSAGLGAGSYDPGSGECKRSSGSYPALWAAAHHVRRFAFTACSGATAKDVAAGQLGPLDRHTALVSVTAGGNDAGFGEVMETCMLGGESTCQARITQARTYIQQTLPHDLDAVYSAIRGKAPAARVVVLGYPRLFTLHGRCLLGMSETKRTAIDEAADALDAVMSKRAAGHGFVFADVRQRFTGHGICSEAPWIRSATFPVSESYHPTAAGHAQGYLPVFAGTARG